MRARAAAWLFAVAGTVALSACSGGRTSVAPSGEIAAAPDVTTFRSAVNTTVLVTVTNTNGAPQVGATVYAQKQSTGAFVQTQTTNSQGVATFSLASNHYRFATAGYGTDAYFYSGAPGSCTTPACTSASITTTIPVLVTVVDSNGVPQVDSEVFAEDSGGNFVNFAWTDSAGQALISVQPGTFRFSMGGYQGGFFFRSAECTVPGCTAATVTSQLPISVTMVTASGQPLANVEVLTEDTEGYYRNADWTDAEGHVLLSADVGAYRVAADYGEAIFYSGAPGSCVIPGCTSVTIVVPDPVVVTVVNAGQPMANQTVVAQSDSYGSSSPKDTDATGHVTFTIPAGAWRFEASCGSEVFHSGAPGSCVIPGCTTATITMICGGCTGQPDGTTCNDSNACTQTDTCQSGACTGSNPVTCTAQDQCHTAGTCNSSTGACSNPAKANGTTCNDGDACTQTDTCQSGACTGSNPVTCTAQDQCHTAGTCNSSTGACSNPAKANGAACNDGDACTQTDICQSGACTGSNPVTCTAQDQCHSAGTCSSSTGTCSNPAKADGTACNDGNSCTQTDTCQSGACTGGNPVTCTAQDQCHTAGTCNSSTGTCSNPARADGTACNDTNACTQTDTCQSGACTGGNPVTCVASDQCHAAGTCNTSTGTCSNPALADGSSCNDGNSCTGGDSCQSGSCTPGSTNTCGTITVTVTATTNTEPIVEAALQMDRSLAAPGDAVVFTSTVTNSGTMLRISSQFDVQNNGSSPFIVQGYQQTLEYQAVPSGVWTPFARIAFDADRNLIPETTLMPIVYSSIFPSGGNADYAFQSVIGTSIPAGGNGHWVWSTGPILAPEVTALLFDPAQSSGLRVVTRLDVPSAAAQSGSAPLEYPNLDLDVNDIDAQLTFSLPGSDNAVSGTLTSSASGPLAVGDSRIFTGTFAAPTLTPFPRVAGETETDYRNRLVFASGGYQTRVAVTAHAAPANPASAQAIVTLPMELPLLVGAHKTGPATVNAGLFSPYQVSLPNSGRGAASSITLTDSIDGQPVTITNLSLPPTITTSATGAASFKARSALDRLAGPMTDVVALTWEDRNGDVYGPITASYTGGVAPGHPEGYLSLTTATTDIPDLVGSTKTMTVTALDPYGLPAPGVSVHFAVTETHAQTADLTTGTDGKATFSYAGVAIGNDHVVASATITTTVVTSNVIDVNWVTSVGTPCTGRATPLDIVIAVDMSSSMVVDIDPPTAASTGKLEAARDAAHRFIDNLTYSRDQIGVVTFLGIPRLSAMLGTDAANAKAQLDDRVNFAIGCATNICGENGSNVTGALDIALDELEGPRHRPDATKVLVYIGDGGNEPFVDPTSRLTRLRNSGARAVAIAVGSKIDGAFIRQIASSANDYFYAPGAAGVDFAFNNLTQDVCRNLPPVVSAGGDQGAYNVRIPSMLTLQGEVHDDGAAGDQRLTSLWTTISGPTSVAFEDATSPVTNALFTEPGTYVLQLEATDGYLTVADRATITVDPDPSLVGANLAVALSAAGPLETGQTETLTATLTDGLATPIRNFAVRLTVAGANPFVTTAITDANGVIAFTYQGSKVGTDVLHATALGSNFALDSAFLSVVWIQPASGGAALTQGWIAAPFDHAKISESVEVVLSSDITLASGTVKYFPAANPAEVHILAANVSGAPGAIIATFDTTVVPNDSYVLELDGTDQAGNQKTSVVQVIATGDYKPGRVVFEVTDFTLPLAGLPITIGRRYDSLEKDKDGEFGHGWALAIGHPRVAVDQNHAVSITLPNGRRATFDLRRDPPPFAVVAGPANPFRDVYFIGYQGEPGVFGTLTQTGGCPVVRYFPEDAANPIHCFFTFGLPPDYVPDGYVYTDPYGTAYSMAASGEMRSITDRQGNKLSFEANGIISNSGKSITFERDAQGHITKVTTPGYSNPGNLVPADILYTYDAAGDLTIVDRLSSGETEQVKYTYDQHRLTHTVDPRGNPARTSTYDTAGRLATDTDAAGNVTSYAYNIGTRTSTTTYPDEGVVTEMFDARGLLLSETDQLGHTTTHVYDADRNETKKTNALGEETTALYERGNLRSITDPIGTRYLTYNDLNLPVTFVDRLSHTTTVDYDDRGVPSRIADELGTLFSSTSSEQGVPLTMDDAAGKRAFLTYDAAGNVTSRTDRLGRITQASYDFAGHRISETSARGAVRTNVYHFNGKLAFSRGPNNLERTLGYDRNGNLVSDIDTGGHRTNFAYNALDQLTQVRDFPDGSNESIVSYTRDFRGNPKTITDEGNHTTTYEYDLLGRLTKTTFNDGTSTERTYDPLGRLASLKDERDNITAYTYDPGCGCSDRVASVTDARGTTVTTYDANGRRSLVTDANGHTTSFVYDVRNHLLETHYPDGTSTIDTYDSRGRRVTTKDQTNAVTTFGYDDQGQLTSVTDPLSNVTHYAYDVDGNLTSVTDPNDHTTSYEYDLLKRKTKRTLPLGQFEAFTYNLAGNLTAHTDLRGKTTTMTYDNRNRMLSNAPDPSLGEPPHVYTYSATDKRLTASDASGVTTYVYDDLRDRLTKKIAPAGTLEYTYDDAGNVATIHSLNTNGTDVSYVWDATNQLASVTDHRLGSTTSATYTATKRPSTLTQPNGISLTYSYDDSIDRVISMVWRQGASPVASWTYAHNDRGQRIIATDITGRSAAYGYDAASRLTSETISGAAGGPGSNGAINYLVDGFGNRKSRTSAVSAVPPASYSYDANDQLATDSYDANGNTIAAGGHTYAYDFGNRLVSKDNGAVTIVYDCDGNRVAKTVGGVTTKYLVDDHNPTGYLQVLEEISGGNVRTRFTYGTNLISQTRDASSLPVTRYYGYDAHANVVFLTDASGSVTDSYDYDAWGILVASTGSTPNTRRYAGEELDPDIGFVNLRARQYNSDSGRFSSIDPVLGKITSPVTLNRYAYADVDPVNRSDPSGKEAFLEWAGKLSEDIKKANEEAKKNLKRTAKVIRLVSGGDKESYLGIMAAQAEESAEHGLQGYMELGACGFWIASNAFDVLEAAQTGGEASPPPSKKYKECKPKSPGSE